jgi:hypothetical protein
MSRSQAISPEDQWNEDGEENKPNIGSNQGKDLHQFILGESKQYHVSSISERKKFSKRLR